MSVNREGLEKLAPCECGRPAKLQGTQIVEGRATRWYARCELATCWFGPERDSPERAAESWNRRALLAAGTEGLRQRVNDFIDGAEFAINKIEAGDTFKRNWAYIEACNLYNGGNALAARPVEGEKK